MCTYSLRLLMIVFVLCLLPIRMSQAETMQLSLEDCIQIALENNPQIEIARQQYFANQGVLTQAKSFYWPQLSGGLGYGRQYIDTEFPVTEDNVGSGLLQISQLIFDFGKTTGLIDASSFNLEASSTPILEFHAFVG